MVQGATPFVSKYDRVRMEARRANTPACGVLVHDGRAEGHAQLVYPLTL
jgi:hypothetical protein